MTRKNITVEALKAKGCKECMFCEGDMAKAVELIKAGFYCELVPEYPGTMVCKIGSYKNDRFATLYFFRSMTEEEKVKYADELEKQKEQLERIEKKSRAKFMRSLRRR